MSTTFGLGNYTECFLHPAVVPAVGADDSGAAGVQGELDAIAAADLVEDLVQVRLDGLLADEKALGHFRIAEPKGHKTDGVAVTQSEWFRGPGTAARSISQPARLPVSTRHLEQQCELRSATSPQRIV